MRNDGAATRVEVAAHQLRPADRLARIDDIGTAKGGIGIAQPVIRIEDSDQRGGPFAQLG